MMAADPKQKQRQRQEEPPKPNAPSHYKGFVAGVFSGIAKLTGMLFLSPSVRHAYLKCR